MATRKDTAEDEINRTLAERAERARRIIADALAGIAAPVALGEAGTGGSIEEDGLSSVRAFLDATRAPASQKEILSALLETASRQVPRSALFILRADTAVAWAFRLGPSEGGRGASRALHLTLPSRGDHLVARAVSAAAACVAGPEGPGFVITERLGGPVPVQSAAVPILVRGRVVAILYGDTGATHRGLPEATLSILGRLGGLALESLSAARRARPQASGETSAGRLRVEVGPSNPVPARRSESATPRSPEDHMAPADGVDPFNDFEIPPLSTPALTVVAPEEAEMQALLTDLDGMRHGTGESGLSPEDERLHADARRFASLLISEILLYNEEAVIQGRRHHDLARRLAKEIDKSRQAYAARLPAHLRSAARYFEEELVRVLAEGDAAAVGA